MVPRSRGAPPFPPSRKRTMPNDPYAVNDMTEEPMEREGSGEESAMEGETALLPKSIFGGKTIEPGSKCTFEVVRIHGDEIEVKYSKESKPTMIGVIGGLDQIAKPYGEL